MTFGEIPAGDIALLSCREILDGTSSSECITIHFESPLRLLLRGSIARSFDFSLFFRSQLRRGSSLYAYYGDGELEIDYRLLSDAAEKVSVLESNVCYSLPRWSSRRDMAGLLGSASFCGLADGMSQLLTLGSCFNAGKGSSFGFGSYRIESGN
ncbi:MAG: CRISPR system precrRNA processing endoribonuclease RAMP protein Cas6 [Desulfuromonadales bacterium]